MRAVFPRFADRFAVIPVGANLPAPSAPDRTGWRAAHGVPADAPMFLFQGGLHPSKEIASVRAALDAVPDARLVLIGGGRLDHPRAIALGHLPEAEAAGALAAADLALAPFDDGASGRRTTIVNALGAGLPVVSTLGANTDLALFPPTAIRLVPPGDPAAYAAAVAGLAGDAEARATMAGVALAVFERSFAWPVLAARWRPVLEDVADGL